MDRVEQYMQGWRPPCDRLTSLERTTLYSRGQEVDRIPCCIDGGETMAPLIGCSVRDYYFSGEKMCQVEEYIHTTFGSDGAGLSTTLRGMAEAMGSRIKYAANATAQLEIPAIPLDGVDRAKRVDIDRDGRLPILLQGVRLTKERLGHLVSVSCSVTGPFTVAAMVVGTEQLLIGMLKKPEKVHQLLEVVLENNCRLIDRLVDMGVGIAIPDPLSSTALISVKQYRQFSLPYFRRMVEHINRIGGGCGLHICGTSRALWEDLRETGIGAFGLDNVEDIAEAKAVLGPHMAIQGNVPPVEVMCHGTPADVLASARRCILKGWDSPRGFTLTSGCQLPIGTPEENMHALMDAARIFGRYPLGENLY